MTTTDPFITAAREEAHAYWNGTLQDDTVGVRDLGGHIARWARTHLAAQEPTTVEVQAFQDCLYGRTLTWVPGVEVRAALSEARAARRDEEKRDG